MNGERYLRPCSGGSVSPGRRSSRPICQDRVHVYGKATQLSVIPRSVPRACRGSHSERFCDARPKEDPVRPVSPKTIHLIAAARPNFMKVAPLYHALKGDRGYTALLVHTGQHYDANMSGAFLRDLELPEPAYHLEVGSGTHAEQTGGTMIAYERVCEAGRPDAIVVVGDV